MFNLLGLTIERKKKKLLSNHIEKINKTMNRLTKQQKHEIKIQREKEFFEEQAQLETRAGGFEKIYPISNGPGHNASIARLQELYK